MICFCFYFLHEDNKHIIVFIQMKTILSSNEANSAFLPNDVTLKISIVSKMKFSSLMRIFIFKENPPYSLNGTRNKKIINYRFPGNYFPPSCTKLSSRKLKTVVRRLKILKGKP
uniref:Uncharacterized protein n=1 Tax=Cacopsylla melanoneura TaxID=428564 RepID=A0A8D9AJI0_9HEMI